MSSRLSPFFYCRAAGFEFLLSLSSYSTYRLNLLVSLASSWIGVLSYFFNASFRDVVISSYGVSYTSFALSGAVAACFLSVVVVPISPQDLTMVGFWGKVTGDVLAHFTLSIVKALPVLILSFGYLRITAWLLLTLPLALAMYLVISVLLTLSDVLTHYENPIHWVYFGLWNLMGGVWFPVEALPYPLPFLAYLLPQYHLISLIRDPLIGRIPTPSLLYSSLALILSVPTYRLLMGKVLSTGSLVAR